MSSNAGVEKTSSAVQTSQVAVHRAGGIVWSKPYVWVFVVAAAALVLSLPALVRGPMPAAHDTVEHMNFGKYFAQQFWQGDLYPRWLMNLNHRLGSPSLFVYPPLQCYVFALLLPVAKILQFNAFSASEYLCLLISGLSAFVWIRTMAGARVSLIVAAIYMLLPYHLAVDFYRRGALAECWALAWMPLVLYFTTQAVKKKPCAVASLGVVYALLILSHLISVLLFSALPLLLALILAERGRRIRALASVAGGLTLGVAVSASYLVPAVASAKYFHVSRLGCLASGTLGANLLVFGKGLFTGSSMKTGFVQAISLSTVDTALFILFCGVLALKNGPKSRRRQTWLWLAVCVVPLFLMSSASSGLWTAFPALRDAVQFPWRFNIVLCIAALPLASFFLSDLSRPVPFRFGSLAVVVLFAATWLAGYGAAVKRYDLPAYPRMPVDEDDGWFDAWKPLGMDESSALRASMDPPFRFLSGQGTANVLLWSPRRIEVQTDCNGCGPLLVNQLYYPAWRALLVSGLQPLSVGPALPQGILEVQVPPGRRLVRLEIPRELSEDVGIWISALGILTSALLFVLGFARHRRSMQLQPAHDLHERRSRRQGSAERRKHSHDSIE
jgi:hypothetical protein